MEASGSIKIYLKTNFSSVYEYVNNISDIFVLISKSKYTHLILENYKELSHEDALKYMTTDNKYENDYVEIKGEKITKSVAQKKPQYRFYISNLETYFGEMSKKYNEEKN